MTTTVQQQQRGSQAGGGGRDYIEKTIKVPSEAVGMIIGKGGETIKDMQKTTNCKINVNQPKPPDQYRNIDLAGSSKAMADAERTIWEKVETVRQRDSAAGRSHGGGGGGAAPQQYDAYSQQQALPGYGGGYGGMTAFSPVPAASATTDAGVPDAIYAGAEHTNSAATVR